MKYIFNYARIKFLYVLVILRLQKKHITVKANIKLRVFILECCGLSGC